MLVAFAGTAQAPVELTPQSAASMLPFAITLFAVVAEEPTIVNGLDELSDTFPDTRSASCIEFAATVTFVTFSKLTPAGKNVVRSVSTGSHSPAHARSGPLEQPTLQFANEYVKLGSSVMRWFHFTVPPVTKRPASAGTVAA